MLGKNFGILSCIDNFIIIKF